MDLLKSFIIFCSFFITFVNSHFINYFIEIHFKIIYSFIEFLNSHYDYFYKKNEKELFLKICN